MCVTVLLYGYQLFSVCVRILLTWGIPKHSCFHPSEQTSLHQAAENRVAHEYFIKPSPPPTHTHTHTHTHKYSTLIWSDFNINNQSTHTHTHTHWQSLCSSKCLCVCICVCVSSPRTVNREIKDERVLWSSPPLAAQSGVLAKFPLWCRCGARVSFFHRDTETAVKWECCRSRRAGGQWPATPNRAPPQEDPRGRVGQRSAVLSLPQHSLSLSLSRYLLILSGPVTAACRNIPDFLFLEVVGGRRWTGGAVRRPHTHLLWECPGGNTEQTARRRPLSRSQLSPTRRDLPVHTAHAIFPGKSLTQQKHVCVSVYLFIFKLSQTHHARSQDLRSQYNIQFRVIIVY